jgi:hypothetical protein
MQIKRKGCSCTQNEEFKNQHLKKDWTKMWGLWG